MSTVEQLRAALGDVELVGHRRVSDDADLFIVATRRAAGARNVTIGELDLTADAGRYWTLEVLTAPIPVAIELGLTAGENRVMNRLLSEGLYPEPSRNPRLAELRLRAVGGDEHADRALAAYLSDAELEAAEAASSAADFTS